jgi:hypothetical protein
VDFNPEEELTVAKRRMFREAFQGTVDVTDIFDGSMLFTVKRLCQEGEKLIRCAKTQVSSLLIVDWLKKFKMLNVFYCDTLERRSTACSTNK